MFGKKKTDDITSSIDKLMAMVSEPTIHKDMPHKVSDYTASQIRDSVSSRPMSRYEEFIEKIASQEFSDLMTVAVKQAIRIAAGAGVIGNNKITDHIVKALEKIDIEVGAPWDSGEDINMQLWFRISDSHDFYVMNRKKTLEAGRTINYVEVFEELTHISTDELMKILVMVGNDEC